MNYYHLRSKDGIEESIDAVEDNVLVHYYFKSTLQTNGEWKLIYDTSIMRIIRDSKCFGRYSEFRRRRTKVNRITEYSSEEEVNKVVFAEML